MQTIDPDLIDYMDKVPARFNHEITQGYAANTSDKMVSYLDSLLEVCSKTFQDNGKPIVYLGYTYVTPEQRVNEETRPINNKCTYEITKGDYRMIRVNFGLTNGEHLRPRYLWVPYIDHNGLFRLSGATYHVSPTFSDDLFSVEKGSIYMPVTRGYFSFKRNAYYFLGNGGLISCDYLWGKLYYKKGKEAPKNRHPQLLNYILAEKGFTQTFKDCFGVDVWVGGPDTFNDIDFPEDEWVICSSAGNKPRGRITNADYSTPSLRIAVRLEDFEKQAVKTALCSIFYISDVCGDLAAFDWREFDEPYMWKRILARFIWRVDDEADALEMLDEHIHSISEYIDALVIKKLKRLHIQAETVNEVFAYMLSHFHEIVANSDVGDLSKKRLTVVENVMSSAQIMIFKIMFSLLKMPNQRFKYDIVNRMMDLEWHPRVLLSINSGHSEIQVLESTTDQKVYKLGRIAEYPSKHSAKQKSAEMTDPAFALHPSQAWINSYTFITKSSPTGRGSLNIFLNTDDSGHFILPDELRPYIENLTSLMTGV